MHTYSCTNSFNPKYLTLPFIKPIQTLQNSQPSLPLISSNISCMANNQPQSQNSPSRPPSLSDYYGLVDDNCTLELEDALFHLGLTSPPSQHQRPLIPPGFRGQNCSDRGKPPIDNSIIGGRDNFGTTQKSHNPVSSLANADNKLQTLLRVPNAVNGQMMDFRGSHINLTVGEQVSDYGLNSFSGPFLECKKRLRNQFNSQIQIVLQSNEQMRNGNELDDSNVSRPNLHLHQLTPYLDSLSLGDLRGQVFSLSKNANGSNLLRKLIKQYPNEDEIELVLSDMINHVGKLMRDRYGNYVIQEIFKVCNEKQKTRIIQSLTKSRSQFIKICFNPYGARAVMVLLDNINSQQQISLVMSALSPAAAALANNPNGHFIIRHCVQNFSCEDSRYLINEMAIHCFEVATDSIGSRVLQSCLLFYQGECRERLLAETMANALHLAEDPHGNFVVQLLLEMRIAEVTENILRQFEGSYLALSSNKYSSCVVERCLTVAGEEQATRIIVELLTSPNVCMLLVDPFGNFVIQTALEVSQGVLRKALFNLVRLNAPFMHSNLFGKRVLAFFDDFMKLQHDLPFASKTLL